jgi:hypothetical protein
VLQCGLGFLLLLFCGGKEKNKINSIKFPPTYQRAKFHISISCQYAIYNLICGFLHLQPTDGGMASKGLRAISYQDTRKV